MDGIPGLIHSGDDFRINAAGLIITETTIGSFSGFDPHGIPEFAHARKAMQYAASIDDFARMGRPAFFLTILRPCENSGLKIVSTGIYYALALGAAGALVGWLAGPWYAAPMALLALFCLYFFRDPDREIPSGPVAVAPADGKVVAIKPEGGLNRVSIFLNVFDVHVNRTPIGGVIEKVQYQEGKFLLASREECSRDNEQNIVTVTGDGTTVIFKQIAGLIARRIVFDKKAGDHVAIGERIGLIKFGSRCDVLFGPEWEITVRPGQRVAAGSSVIARRLDRKS